MATLLRNGVSQGVHTAPMRKILLRTWTWTLWQCETGGLVVTPKNPEHGGSGLCSGSCVHRGQWQTYHEVSDLLYLATTRREHYGPLRINIHRLCGKNVASHRSTVQAALTQILSYLTKPEHMTQPWHFNTEEARGQRSPQWVFNSNYWFIMMCKELQEPSLASV